MTLKIIYANYANNNASKYYNLVYILFNTTRHSNCTQVIVLDDHEEETMSKRWNSERRTGCLAVFQSIADRKYSILMVSIFHKHLINDSSFTNLVNFYKYCKSYFYQ